MKCCLERCLTRSASRARTPCHTFATRTFSGTRSTRPICRRWTSRPTRSRGTPSSLETCWCARVARSAGRRSGQARSRPMLSRRRSIACAPEQRRVRALPALLFSVMPSTAACSAPGRTRTRFRISRARCCVATGSPSRRSKSKDKSRVPRQETEKLDALVAEQQRLIALLREKRQTIISHAVSKGCDAPVQLKASGVAWLGDIPAHWGVVQSRRLFRVRSEAARSDDQRLTASQKYGILFQREFVELEGRRVVETILGRDSLLHVEPNDFVIGMRSFQGGLEHSTLRGSISFHYVMLTPVKDVYPPLLRPPFQERSLHPGTPFDEQPDSGRSRAAVFALCAGASSTDPDRRAEGARDVHRR